MERAVDVDRYVRVRNVVNPETRNRAGGTPVNLNIVRNDGCRIVRFGKREPDKRILVHTRRSGLWLNSCIRFVDRKSSGSCVCVWRENGYRGNQGEPQ